MAVVVDRSAAYCPCVQLAVISLPSPQITPQTGLFSDAALVTPKNVPHTDSSWTVSPVIFGEVGRRVRVIRADAIMIKGFSSNTALIFKILQQ